RRTTSTLLK
ncbi:unnamed protein product, partial [Rotaria sordida]